MMAIKNDDELAKYFGNGDFVNAGFVPKVKPVKGGDGKKKKAEVDSDSEWSTDQNFWQTRQVLACSSNEVLSIKFDF